MKKITEEQIIDLVSNKNSFREEVIVPIGEDTSVLYPKQDKNIVITTDTMNINTHFKSNITPYELGYISAISNISDLSTMGAEPAFALINLSLNTPTYDFIHKLTEGYNDVFKNFSITILGGDTTKGETSITMTLIGYAVSNNYMLTTDAQKDDLIYISGNVGEMLNSHQKNEYFLHKDRNQLGKILTDYASACTDMSDGLLKSLKNICKKSDLGASINLDKVCINENIKKQILDKNIKLEDVLSYGEDYELIFTINPLNSVKIKNICKQLSIDITEIGSLSNEGRIDFLYNSNIVNIDINKEFEHFKKND